MVAIGRRAFLVGALATATAACGRVRPVAARTTTEFTVTTVFGRAPTTSTRGMTPAQHLAAASAAAAAWWSPVLQAFNESHRHFRARFAPIGIDPKATSGGWGWTPNPAVSCRAGVSPIGMGGSVDLASAIRDANLDTTALLPGILAASTDPDGRVRGTPIDLSLCAVWYHAAALQKAHVSPPPLEGWTVDQFSAAVSDLATTGSRAATFGNGLAAEFYGGQNPPWFGFAEGYGGTVFGDRVVLASGPVYQGLKAYADILRSTWAGADRISPSVTLEFAHSGLTTGAPPWPAQGLSRFPRLPVPAVPADVIMAEVPITAPNAAAGATFTVWLATRDGQRALTGIGYPAVRTDAPGGSTPFEKAQTGVRPTDLRFRPAGIFGCVYGGKSTCTVYGFDRRLVLALLQPEPVRLSRLQAFEQALSGLLDGSLDFAQADGVLKRAGA